MNGGAMEDRTPDLRIANATLYQLSYDPNRGTHCLPEFNGLARAKPLASEPVEAALRVEVDELEVLFLV